MKLKKLFYLFICLLTVFSLSANESDGELKEDADLLGSDFIFDINAEINAASTVSNSASETSALKLEESFISLSASWKNKIRAVITGKLEEAFKDNKIEWNDGFSVQEFVKEAYIEIRELGGIPVAIVVGKHPIAFGQNVQAMPIFNNNPLARLQEIDQVYGITVELTEGLFGLFDQVELSVFETQGGDLELGKIDGLSVRLSKFLTEQWLLTLSHAELGNSHLNTGHERRTSIGLIGETKNGDLVGWIEAIIFSNNPQYPNSRVALTGGLMYRVHRTTDIVVEYSYVHKAVHDLGLGIKTNLTKNLTAGAEIRYRNYVERNQHEVIFGINLTYRFGLQGERYNEEYLFGDGGKSEGEGEFSPELE